MNVYGSMINGKEIKGANRTLLQVYNPFSSEAIGAISCATMEDITLAVETANEAFHYKMKNMPAIERADILRKTADLLEARTEEFARMIVKEAGKPIRDARIEVIRAIYVLRLASDGAKNMYGEQIPMDSAPGGENQIGLVKRVPLGVVAAITPFNLPLNTVLHKVAPAIAAGNTVVLKPAEKTPFSAFNLYQLFEEAGLPPGVFNIINGPGADLVQPLVSHPFVKKVSFTGSGPVGWKIQELAKKKKVTLELGSNAPNIIFPDADLENAAEAIASGGFILAGQACISAQRIYIHQEVYSSFVDKLKRKVKKIIVGDPIDEQTQLGPMITEEAAERAESWIKEATASGATVLIGGARHGALMEPTIIEGATSRMKVVCQEVFAPIISVIPFDQEEEVISLANDSEFGLHAGLFTNDINRAMKVADALEYSGVWINECSVRRHDHIPYGGIKNSGIGKEGIRYAIEGMTEQKFLGVKIL